MDVRQTHDASQESNGTGHAQTDPRITAEQRAQRAWLQAAEATAELRMLELIEADKAASDEPDRHAEAVRGAPEAERERPAAAEQPPASLDQPVPPHTTQYRSGSYDSAPGILVLWRRRSTVLLLTILLGCAFGGVYFLLPERYESTVRLEARSTGKQSSFEFLQASQILARTYSEIARSRVIADLVAGRLPFQRTQSNILDDVSVETVSDTPLIKITATQGKGSEARALADTYARTLLRYVDRESRAEAGSLTLVHGAESPTRAGPGLPIMVAVGAMLGLLLGVAIVFFQERLDASARPGPRE